MATINFNQIGSFNGIEGGSKVLNNPTSLQFGPDGRLYVAEQNGSINAFTVTLQDGQYIATAHEELLLANGSEVVKSIQNHNDDGSLGADINSGNPVTNRQVTGIVAAGTAANPVLYISSSDPRIGKSGEKQLDTNSGVVTRVTWTGTEWEAVDIIRGLPRSEENHSVNGMVLSPDGTKLYLAVGGNTNNGAPSEFFSYTGEYALSGTVLEIDLTDIESRSILTDLAGGQNGTSRQYVYDLPTLDDPTVANDGVREDSNGLDVAGPWGGNDGFNMAILPDDAPIRIFADGFRNNYDLVFSESGQLYTVDNGSNSNLGGNPLDADGNPTDQSGAGEATNTPNNGGAGNPEPLFLIEDGGYYGHPAPARANQDLPWTVYDDNGAPDTSLFPNQVSDLSSLVPNGVNIQNGFIIDPSKFTGDATRLSQSGIRIPYNSSESPSLFNLGSSSNGLVEYTGDSFDGALKGALIVTQFNGNVTLLNLSQDGTTLEPLIDPGNDGILGTADDETIDADGVFPLVTGQSQPLDVTVGPDGTIWVAEFGPDNIKVFVPSDIILPEDPDFDNDGILNVDDPFIRDATNGNSVLIVPGQTLLWDFDANQDDNLPGPNGYGGGLTGVMIDGTTDFEQFFQEPATFPDQIIKLDNVKFTTAAGGGTTVIEFVSNGSPFASNNDGEYLFHTGVSTTPTVETFTVKWTVFNPANFFTGPSQQIGGYLGTGDQSNYLKIVAVQDTAGEVQILLEDNDVVLNSSFIQADDLFQVPDNQKIFFELEIDPSAATATPTVTYELGDGTTNTVSGNAIDLSGTNVLDAILGNYTVQGQTSGLAVGLLASNMGQPEANTFQAIFDDIEITATGDSSSTVLYRVNAGGPEIAAVDGGIAWSADTASNNSLFLIQAGSNNTASFTAVEPGVTVPSSVPGTIFDTERWDKASAPEMQWGFDVPEAGLYEVRLYMGNGFGGTSASGERVFDVVLEGQPVSSFPNLDNIDLSQQFGHQIGGLISNTVNVTDGILNIEFLHDIEDNPLINGIEILQIGDGTPQMPTVSIADSAFTISEADSQIQISLTSNIQVPAGEAVDITFEIVPETATPQLDYEYLSATASFDSQIGVYTDTITIAENLSDVNFIIDILPDNIVENEEAFTVNITGISSNAQIGADTASVTIEDDDSTGNTSTVLYRVNVGGSEIAAVDGGLAWSADTKAINSTFLVEPGSNSTASFAAVEPGVSVPDSTPGAIFDTERWDSSGGAEMQWGFDVPEAGLYEVRLYMGNGWGGTKETGARVFDIALEGSVPNNLNDIDLSSQFGHQVGGLISNTVNVNDGTLNIDFLHGVENPLINGIEIIQLDGGTPSTPTVSIIGGPYTINEADPQVQISLLTDITVPNGEAVDVTFEIIPESATPELDYVYLAGTFDQATGIYTDTLTIAENSSDATFLIDILQDTFTESDEAFTINVTGVSSNAAIGTDTALVTIEDDDSATQNEVSIATTQNAAEPNVDGLFTVSLSEVASTDTVINYSIAGTAIADQDYEALTGTVTIVAGDLSAPIDVVILDDQEVESIEDVIVTLDTITAGDSNILFGTADTATVTIVDDDAPTQNEVSIVTTQNAAEPDVDGLFTVSLSEVASTDTVISYTVAGTAIADQDYEALTETVTIVAGDLSAPIDVTVLDDQEVESIEDVIVTLDTISAGDSNILFGTADTATVTIADDDISGATVLYRVNAGGSQVAAVDGGLAWSADTVDNNSPFLVNPGSNDTASFAAVEPGATVPNSTPGGIFDTERWDSSGGSEMQWAFDVPASGSYEVRLYMGNGWGGTQDPGARVFDLALEGSVPSNLDNVDLSNQFGHLVGGVISNTLTVDDGTLNIEFIHDVQNPLINGIEILQLDA